MHARTHIAGGSQRLVLHTTHSLLTLLGTLLRCARARLPAAAACRVARALPLPTLLSTLAEG
jgi:hypothetical protein